MMRAMDMDILTRLAPFALAATLLVLIVLTAWFKRERRQVEMARQGPERSPDPAGSRDATACRPDRLSAGEDLEDWKITSGLRKVLDEVFGQAPRTYSRLDQPQLRRSCARADQSETRSTWSFRVLPDSFEYTEDASPST